MCPPSVFYAWSIHPRRFPLRFAQTLFTVDGNALRPWHNIPGANVLVVGAALGAPQLRRHALAPQSPLRQGHKALPFLDKCECANSPFNTLSSTSITGGNALSVTTGGVRSKIREQGLQEPFQNLQAKSCQRGGTHQCRRQTAAHTVLGRNVGHALDSSQSEADCARSTRTSWNLLSVTITA